MQIPRSALVGLAAAAAAVWLYGGVASKLVHDWLHDDNYSHGVLIVPLALFFAWERRAALRQAPIAGSIAGLILVAASLGLLVAGTLGAELFLTRVSIIGTIAGTVLFLCGWRHVRILAFPLLFLFLMVPIPAIIFNQIAFPLQLLASKLGTAGMQACSVPVLREGNVIVLANTTLEVAEACSGIRSLVSLLTLGIVYGYFTDKRVWVRTFVALSTVPIAIAANGFRVGGTGVLAHYYGPDLAQGFFHEFSGWLVFVVALVMLFVLTYIIRTVAPERTGSGLPVEVSV
jgi:exosortase